jgi:hypothetical protein
LARRRIRAKHAFVECPMQEDHSGSRREDLKLSKAAFIGEMSQLSTYAPQQRHMLGLLGGPVLQVSRDFMCGAACLVPRVLTDAESP